MWVTQPAWRHEVLSDATRVRIAKNCGPISHRRSFLDLESTFCEIEASRRALPTRCRSSETSAPIGPTFKYRDSYEAPGDLPWPHFRCDRMRSPPRAPMQKGRAEGADSDGFSARFIVPDQSVTDDI